MGMMGVSFVILVVFGKSENGNEVKDAALLSIFMPMLTPIIALLFAKAALKEWVMALYFILMLVVISLQVLTLYWLK